MHSFTNDGSEAFRIQNKWTKYLEKSLHRTRSRYIERLAAIRNAEKGDYIEDTSSSSVSFDESAQIRYDVRHALEKLPVRAQSIVKMKLLGDMTFREIAVALGLNEGAVSMVYYRAIKEMGWWLE